MIPIKITLECRCPKCDEYIKNDTLFILKEDDFYEFRCDYCYCELYSIVSNEELKGEEK